MDRYLFGGVTIAIIGLGVPLLLCPEAMITLNRQEGIRRENGTLLIARNASGARNRRSDARTSGIRRRLALTERTVKISIRCSALSRVRPGSDLEA
jgi:hypothetical protein